MATTMAPISHWDNVFVEDKTQLNDLAVEFALDGKTLEGHGGYIYTMDTARDVWQQKVDSSSFILNFILIRCVFGFERSAMLVEACPCPCAL